MQYALYSTLKLKMIAQKGLVRNLWFRIRNQRKYYKNWVVAKLLHIDSKWKQNRLQSWLVKYVAQLSNSCGSWMSTKKRSIQAIRNTNVNSVITPLTTKGFCQFIWIQNITTRKSTNVNIVNFLLRIVILSISTLESFTQEMPKFTFAPNVIIQPHIEAYFWFIINQNITTKRLNVQFVISLQTYGEVWKDTRLKYTNLRV